MVLEKISEEVAKIRAERAERAKLKAAGQWPPAAPAKPAPKKKPASKKKPK